MCGKHGRQCYEQEAYNASDHGVAEMDIDNRNDGDGNSRASHCYPALVRQRTATTCGQCVVAMVLGVKRSVAVQMVGHAGITSDEEIWRQCGTESGFVEGTAPDGVVAVQKHRDPNGDREHWTLWWKDKILDPRNKVEELWPVTKHFVVDWAG